MRIWNRVPDRGAHGRIWNRIKSDSRWRSHGRIFGIGLQIEERTDRVPDGGTQDSSACWLPSRKSADGLSRRLDLGGIRVETASQRRFRAAVSWAPATAAT